MKKAKKEKAADQAMETWADLIRNMQLLRESMDLLTLAIRRGVLTVPEPVAQGKGAGK